MKEDAYIVVRDDDIHGCDLAAVTVYTKAEYAKYSAKHKGKEPLKNNALQALKDVQLMTPNEKPILDIDALAGLQNFINQGFEYILIVTDDMQEIIEIENFGRRDFVEDAVAKKLQETSIDNLHLLELKSLKMKVTF